MDRDVLKQYLDDGLSLIQIGALENRDPSTVGYWVHKHGLVANGRDKYSPRGGLMREQLEPLVEEGASLQEMAVALDRSMSTIRRWLRRHGLESRRARRNRAEFRVADAQGRNRALAKCSRHGLVEFVLRPDGGWRCNKCRSENVVNWRRRNKLELIRDAGGACRLCGYERYAGALQFHHLDPATKEFPISRGGITRSFTELREEAKKCILLCANCHAEVEAGFSTI